MAATVATVAYLGLEARAVEVQVQLSSGLPAFIIVGLADQAVAESRERVRAALAAIGLALPPKRITVNLSPADLPKEGSHYDLPIALGLLAAIGATDAETLSHYIAVGELSLDGRISASPGVLLAAIHASSLDKGLICPAAQGSEAAWAGELDVIAAPDLLALLAHLKGTALVSTPPMAEAEAPEGGPDLAQVKGQEVAKRALEIAAAGGHNLLMSGPPGSGKSLLAACLPGILPPLQPSEALEVSMVASVAGDLGGGKIRRRRATRSPRGNQPRPPRCPVPRRASGIPAAGLRFPSPAAGNRKRQRCARQHARDLPGASAAGRGDEPVPLRPSWRSRARVQPSPALRRRLSGSGLGTAARSNRSPRRG